MSSSSTSNSNTLQLLIRAIIFLFGLIVLYILTVIVMSIIPAKTNTLFKTVIGNQSQTGGQGQTLRRFREVDTTENVDILFIGSSHSSRSFDPRVFARLGMSTINLGSNSQTPLNSYFLLEKYYKKLNPKLVVFEMYPTILQLDGLEGFYELSTNLELDKNIFQMCQAVNNMHGYNSLVERYLRSYFRPLESFDQLPMDNEEYITGGYLRTEIIYLDDSFGPTGDIIISETQLAYFNLIIKYFKENNGKLLVVIAPLPIERIKAITNYETISKTLDSITHNNEILFYDFNNTLKLNTRTDFRDNQHLNGNGAKIFSYALLDSLLDVPNINHALKIKPPFAAEVYTGRGIVLINKNETEQAENDFIKALEIDNNNFIALFNLGLIYSKNENFVKALSYFDEALKLNSKSFEALYNKALNYEMMGENKKASDFYNQSLTYLPPSMENYKQGIIQKVNRLK